MSKKRLIENALSLSAVQVVTLGLPLLSLPYLALTLGAEQLGRLAFVMSIVQVILVFADYGFNLSASKAVSLHRHDKVRIAEIWVSVTLIRSAFAILGLAIVVMAALWIGRVEENLLLILTAYVMVIGNILFPQWLFQGLEQLKSISLIQVVTRASLFVCIFIFVQDKDDVYLAVFLQSAGLLFGGLAAIPSTLKVFKGIPLKWPKKSELDDQLRSGWQVFASTALTNIYTQGNAMFLGMVAPPTVVGQYYLAEKLIRASQLAYGPVSNTIYPHISRLVAQDKATAFAFIGKVLRYVGAGGLVLSICVLVLSPVLVVPIFGKEHAAVVPLLQIFSVLPVVLMLSNTLSIQVMLPFDLQAQLTKVYLCAALLNLVIFIPLSMYAGAEGAAVANVLVEIFIVVLLSLRLARSGINVLQLILNPHIYVPKGQAAILPVKLRREH